MSNTHHVQQHVAQRRLACAQSFGWGGMGPCARDGLGSVVRTKQNGSARKEGRARSKGLESGAMATSRVWQISSSDEPKAQLAKEGRGKKEGHNGTGGLESEPRRRREWPGFVARMVRGDKGDRSRARQPKHRGPSPSSATSSLPPPPPFPSLSLWAPGDDTMSSSTVVSSTLPPPPFSRGAAKTAAIPAKVFEDWKAHKSF